MAEDFAEKLVEKIRRLDDEQKRDGESKQALAKQRPKVWEELKAGLREKADAVHSKLGQSYFEVSNPDAENLSVTVTSPKGKIEIVYLDMLNIVSVYRIKEQALGEPVKETEKTFHFEERDNGVWLRVQNEYLSAGDVAEYALDLLA
jgi:hypothetical protein